LSDIANGDRNFLAITNYAVERQRSGDGRPLTIQDRQAEAAKYPAVGVEGTLSQILARFDRLHERALADLMPLDGADLQTPIGFWYEAPVAFHLHRFEAHLREHTIQVEKTLAMLGRQPREVERIVRLILGAYGRLEAVVLCLPDGTLDGEFGKGRSLAGLLAETANEVAAVAGSIDA